MTDEEHAKILTEAKMHLRVMAPHVRARKTAKVIEELAGALDCLQLGCSFLQGAFLIDGTSIKCQDGAWHLFRRDGECIRSAGSLIELVSELGGEEMP